MASQKHIEVAKGYFKNNPTEGVIHIASDGQVFFQKNYNDAYTHQRRINPDQKLVTIYRTSLEGKAEVETPAGPSAPEVPTANTKNADIAAWLKGRGVSLTGKEKKVDLLALVDDALKEGDAQNDAADENDSDNE